MSTSFEKINFVCSPPLDMKGFERNPTQWLADQPSVGEVAWLLAYADDGVIWGILKEGKLIQAYDVFGATFPKLELKTLQKAHLFGSLGEVKIFRIGEVFKAVRLEDKADPGATSYTRTFYLWGDRSMKTQDGWTWVEDGQLGIHQAIPLTVPSEAEGRKFQIQIRYYVHYEPNHGQARVAASRLLALKLV